MLGILGQPADHLLRAGKFTQNFFTVEETDDGPTWRRRVEWPCPSLFELILLFHLNSFKVILIHILSL